MVTYILSLLLVQLFHSFHGRGHQQVLELLVLHAQRDGVRVEAAVEAWRVRSVLVLLHVWRAKRVRHRPTGAFRGGGLGGHIDLVRLDDIQEDLLLVVVVFLYNLKRFGDKCGFGPVTTNDKQVMS